MEKRLHSRLPVLLPDLAPAQIWAKRIHIALAKHEWSRAHQLVRECRRDMEADLLREVPTLVQRMTMLRAEVRAHLACSGIIHTSQLIIATDGELREAGLTVADLKHIDSTLSEYGCTRDQDLRQLPPLVAELPEDDYPEDDDFDFPQV